MKKQKGKSEKTLKKHRILVPVWRDSPRFSMTPQHRLPTIPRDTPKKSNSSDTNYRVQAG